ncbi:MAG: hypothetical protein KA191_04665 [Verrucomicrobia bacterium]|jgi:hypothetical protein|nr:hypothetical protein [Verrucomicrobiota bacterium]OQC64005.1 MAG: hypothetical protein BWX48_02979 [Verrucomicrobia bacterium ADurb.Bin006]MDI9380553.1 hypothetical protein [Verrucomicrobiota bacterium]NMD18945.1 hypothetical protein [Verrucomicrobiota bacterium]HOA60143.1 hypothetical protein [Verrucomicrobiota bacterium]
MKALQAISMSVGILALIAWGGPGLQAAEESGASSQDNYEGFRIISERNIFNANRSGRAPRRRETPRPSRVDTVALLGTMSYEKGQFAFFDGSDPSYRATLKPGGTIADLKVLDIGANHVRLDVQGNRLDLKVGSQLRREDGGEWKVAARDESPGGWTARPAAASSDSASGRPTESSRTESGSSSSSSDTSEALKRLLEKREREM